MNLDILCFSLVSLVALLLEHNVDKKVCEIMTPEFA